MNDLSPVVFSRGETLHADKLNLAFSQRYAAVTLSDLPPSSPLPGQLWFDTSNPQLYIWYVDPTSAQWVIATAYAGGLTTDAPSDGQVYGRQNGAWQNFAPGGPYLPLIGGTVTGPTTFSGALNYTATGGITTRSAQDRAADTINVLEMRQSGDTADHQMIQRAIDLASSSGRGRVFVPGGTYTLGASLYARSNVTIVAASGVTLLKNYYDGTNGAIFTNQDQTVYVTNFQVLGRPTLGTGASGSGKLVFLLGHFVKMDVALGSWVDNATDGFGIALAGESMDLEVYGGNPLGTNGLAGVQVFGGSGRVRAVGIKSGDDCVGVYAIRPDLANVGGLNIHDLYIEAINCESTGARIVAMGIASTTPFNTATGMNVSNVVANVVGGKACSVSENASGTAAVMIFANTNLPQTNVRQCSVVAVGVDCGGRAYAGRAFNCTDCSIEVRGPLNLTGESAGIAIDTTVRFRGILTGNLSGLANNANVFSVTGTTTGPNLTCDVVVPPRSSAGPAMTFPAAGTVTDATLDLVLREIATGNFGITLFTGATRVNARVKAYPAAAATGTVGVFVTGTPSGVALLAGSDLSQVATPFSWVTTVTTGSVSPGIVRRKIPVTTSASPFVYGTGIPTTRDVQMSASTAITLVEVQRAADSGYVGIGTPACVTLGPFDLLRVTYTGTLTMIAFER